MALPQFDDGAEGGAVRDVLNIALNKTPTEFSNTMAYPEGAIVAINGFRYESKSAVAAGTFNAAQWKLVAPYRSDLAQLLANGKVSGGALSLMPATSVITGELMPQGVNIVAPSAAPSGSITIPFTPIPYERIQLNITLGTSIAEGPLMSRLRIINTQGAYFDVIYDIGYGTASEDWDNLPPGNLNVNPSTIDENTGTVVVSITIDDLSKIDGGISTDAYCKLEITPISQNTGAPVPSRPGFFNGLSVYAMEVAVAPPAQWNSQWENLPLSNGATSLGGRDNALAVKGFLGVKYLRGVFAITTALASVKISSLGGYGAPYNPYSDYYYPCVDILSGKTAIIRLNSTTGDITLMNNTVLTGEARYSVGMLTYI